jgi:hypothetical protein
MVRPLVTRLLLFALGLSVTALPPAAAAHRARARAGAAAAADCQPFAGAPCLLPFPNDLFTAPDASTPTGLRVRLPVNAMPVSSSGQRIAVAEYDRNDGFSPGSTVVLHVPGLDNEQAFSNTGGVRLADMSEAFAPEQPVVIIDQSTGTRQLIWSELDAGASTPQSTDLLIHPGADFSEGHTYVVALRDLRDASGHLIEAPRWFELLRDDRSLPRDERSQRARYERIFAALARAGIPRENLYEAWNFTVSSTQSLTGRLLAIRNNAFQQLGDSALGDGVVQGRAPSFTIAGSAQLTPQLRRVEGTFSVPCYLITCGASATAGFHYSSPSADALPTQLPGNLATAPFECIIPSSASPTHRARISLYGHGFLSSHAEVEAEDVQQLAARYNIVFCATDWWGLAKGDAPFLLRALADVNDLPRVIDRVQQGVLNTLYLGRLMINAQGFASNPAFQIGGEPVIDTSSLYYDGNSDGGILGGITTAVAPDFTRAVLGVAGMDFFNLLVPRGQAFSALGARLLEHYPDQSLHPLILDLLQQLWDRADPDGYAEQMTSQPLPDTPPHVVLMQIAYGDFEVSMYAAAVEARTIGAYAHEPALELEGDRLQDANLFFGIAAISRYPFEGSAIVLWDSGPGRTQPPPLADLPPVASAANEDPHEDPRYTPAAQLQVSDFLAPNGAVADVCDGQPCEPPWYSP